MSLLSVHIKSLLKCSKLGTYLRRRRWNKGITSVGAIEGVIQKYNKDISVKEKEVLISDILDMARKYRFSAEEYFYYHFKDKTEDERKTFISDLNRVDFCESLNLSKNLSIFDDKHKSAEVFGKYYGRDFCGVKSLRDFDKLKKFVSNHNRFMFKPLTGTCGRGICILDISPNDDDRLKQLIIDNCSGSNDGFIVEELVVQASELAQFHPSSLNTIRVATVKFNEGVEVIASFFRTGRGGNIVDNAGAGGVFGTIDIMTGIVDAVGDEFGNNYLKHPDSNIQMVGFQIPKWDEAVNLAKELALIVKGNRYAGWDLALTDNGWVMIEGNARGQFVWQIPRQKGFLKETNDILRRLGMKEMKKLSV